MKRYLFTLTILSTCTMYIQGQTLTGVVRDAETREPLPFASVLLIPEGTGATANAQGVFELARHAAAGASKLIVSFVGYDNDTLEVSSRQSRYTVHLRPQINALQEVVVVSGTMKEVTKSASPIPVEVYTPALFMKNPTPNIFEALTMINGVQPQLNCSVCNTGDIHINGMEGPYTMVLIDGMPIVSSLSTVYGLAGIPNSLVKRIEIVKGPASTLYGSEAVAGLINIITRDPSTTPSLHADVSATHLAEFNTDVATTLRGDKSNALIGINYFNYSRPTDVNNDNFTDVTLQQRISVFNKIDFKRPDDRQASVGLRYVYEDRWGGELQWNKSLRGSSSVYGESIFTNRVELLGNYELPAGKEKVILDYSYNYHLQDSYYGTVKYYANQQVAFGQLRWNKRLGQQHDLLAGIPFRYTYYDDNTVGTGSENHNHPMHTLLPGLFVQDEMKATAKLTLLGGLRWDYHNHHGSIFSPRLSAKYALNKHNTLRLSGGNGFRVVNLFTEDHAALTGSRRVVIENELRPEESWNVNLNYTTQIAHDHGFIGLDVSAFYTYFTNKIVGDFLSDPNLILYDNLDGHAVSRGFTFNTEWAFINRLKVLAGVTLMDVYQRENIGDGSEKIPQLFAPKVSGTYAISYAIDRIGMAFDLTGRFNGPMKLPVGDPDFDPRPDSSPWFTLMNVQASKAFNNGLELYGGVKNLLNFMPKHPILYPDDPFGEHFDTSYNYAPVQGTKAFLGVRFTLP